MFPHPSEEQLFHNIPREAQRKVVESMRLSHRQAASARIGHDVKHFRADIVPCFCASAVRWRRNLAAGRQILAYIVQFNTRGY